MCAPPTEERAGQADVACDSENRLSLVKRQQSLAHFNVIMTPVDQKTGGEVFKGRLQRMVDRWKTSAALTADVKFRVTTAFKKIFVTFLFIRLTSFCFMPKLCI